MQKFKFDKYPKLSADYLLLDELTEDYIDDVIEFSKSINRNLNQKTALDLVHKVNRDFKEGTGITWGIFEGDFLHGTIGYYRGFENHIGEIGYTLKEGSQRKGIMSRAFPIALEFGFDTLQLTEIKAITGKDNMPSIELLKKFNFVWTGGMDKDHKIFSKKKNE